MSSRVPQPFPAASTPAAWSVQAGPNWSRPYPVLGARPFTGMRLRTVAAYGTDPAPRTGSGAVACATNGAGLPPMALEGPRVQPDTETAAAINTATAAPWWLVVRVIR